MTLLADFDLRWIGFERIGLTLARHVAIQAFHAAVHVGLVVDARPAHDGRAGFGTLGFALGRFVVGPCRIHDKPNGEINHHKGGRYPEGEVGLASHGVCFAKTEASRPHQG